MKAKITEVFKSIQGEGLYQGMAQVFVRFFGCNLNCIFCDTKLVYYMEKNIDQLLEEIFLLSGYDSISLTGGEPLLQADFLLELAKELKQRGLKIHLETNGVLYDGLAKVIEYIDVVAMDFKLPSSAKIDSFWPEHENFLKIAQKKEVFVKSVISPDTNAVDIHRAIEIINNVNREVIFVLQPQNPFEERLGERLRYFEDICKKGRVNVRILKQMHKELGIR